MAQGVGPASYVVTASDLHPVSSRNVIVKYADDTVRHGYCVDTTPTQWLKWFYEAGGGGSPNEARLEQTPYPFQPH